MPRAQVKSLAVLLVFLGLCSWLSAKDKSNESGGNEQKVKLSPEEKWLEYIREQLKPSEGEWEVLKPRVDAVGRLVKEVNAGRESKGVREPRPDKQEDLSSPPSETQMRARALNDALYDQFTSPSRIREHVAAYRTAREQAKQRLLRAQEELRQLLTSRQEATLIIMGLLD